MRMIMVGLLGLAFSAASLDAEEKKRGTLPDHPLDPAFRPWTVWGVRHAILNNDLYGKAVEEALAAKKAQEKKLKDNPKLKDASPAQAARVKFLEVLRNEKQEAKEQVGDLPPHPLDPAFERARTVNDIDNGIANNRLYSGAVREAMRAKWLQEQRLRENPKRADASPPQAARVKFLEVLRAEKAEKKDE
jgi:hypothetical protein